MKIFKLALFALALLLTAKDNNAQAEVGYRCLQKEPVLCIAVVPTCVKQEDGSYTTFPYLGEECFDISNCYKEEAKDLNTLVDLQEAQIAKLQAELKKAKAKLKSALRSR